MDHRTFEEVNELVARNTVEDNETMTHVEGVSESSPSTTAAEAENVNPAPRSEDNASAEEVSAATAPAPKPPVQAGESALGTYRRNARKFSIIGTVGCACGLFILLTLRKQNSPLMILAAIVMLSGALIMVTGLSALRSDGMVRAFAQVAAVQPTTAQMQDLLDAMKNVQFSGLNPAVKQQILTAVSRYRGYEGYDVEIADKIEAIAKGARKRSVL